MSGHLASRDSEHKLKSKVFPSTGNISRFVPHAEYTNIIYKNFVLESIHTRNVTIHYVPFNLSFSEDIFNDLADNFNISEFYENLNYLATNLLTPNPQIMYTTIHALNCTIITILAVILEYGSFPPILILPVTSVYVHEETYHGGRNDRMSTPLYTYLFLFAIFVRN